MSINKTEVIKLLIDLKTLCLFALLCIHFLTTVLVSRFCPQLSSVIGFSVGERIASWDS